ncbi:MAG: hypothetical protein ACM3RX_10605 [Methanococcaceae archaeon]
METTARNYYRIYDDKEEQNFFKSNLSQKEIEDLVKKFEADHQEYYNNDFFAFVKKHDPDAALIEIKSIYY